MAPPPHDVQPLYLRTGELSCFVVHHGVADATPGVGVVLCPPFGWEHQAAHRTLGEWASHHAQLGIPCVRLDLPGTGDSAGAFDSPKLVEAWIEAVAGCARWLRRTSGCARIVVAGVGLGGILAVLARDHETGIDDLILWGAAPSGRAAVRELQALARLSLGSGSDAVDDGVVVAGYRLAASTLADLTAIDLQGPPGCAARAGRALVLDRRGAAAKAGLSEALAARELTVEQADGRGFDVLTGEPTTSTMPPGLLDRLATWSLDAPGGAPVGEHLAVQDSTWLDLGAATETPVTLGRAGGPEMAGILSRPRAGVGPVTVVLLNAGAQRRTGPNRMWVEAARAWGARGIPSARIDLPGIGESSGARPLADADLHTGHWVPDLRDALDDLASRGLPADFVLVGLCSGAYWSARAALRDDRVRACLLVNPRTLTWEPSLAVRREALNLRTKVAQPGSWTRLARGRIPLRRVAQSGRAQIADATSRVRHRRGAGENPDVAVLTDLRRRGVRIRLLFTGNEPLLRELLAAGLAPGASEDPGFSLVEIPGWRDIHTLHPVGAQRAIHALLAEGVDDVVAQMNRPPLADA